MQRAISITTVFLDIGGLLLANGWDQQACKRAAKNLKLENTGMIVQIADGLGMQSILHTDYWSTCAKLASFGLQANGELMHETS